MLTLSLFAIQTIFCYLSYLYLDLGIWILSLYSDICVCLWMSSTSILSLFSNQICHGNNELDDALESQ